MGVNHLWSILEPVRKKENLFALSNKTLCVDLSGWICEANCAKGLKHNVSKPHLRNLFFRLLHLTRLGVKLVFVVDGKPPELKWEAIAKRIQARNGGQLWKGKNSAKAAGSGARVGRSHFAVWVRECCTLLNLLGVPCIESKGEAEALCAWLDLHQIVDGCITNDGDAFLYGARTVYKDLCISGKDASVECYKMDEIETKLGLNRQRLVALGILLGCDYLPQGVAGVGKESAIKLMKNVNQDNLIDRFYEWTKGTILDENISSVEKSVKRKALKDKNFPHPEVIEEFLTPKVVPQQVSLKIFNPDLQGLQEFCLKYLEWPEEYTREKVLLLITYWQMTSSLEHCTTTLVQPERIVKTRIQQKIECYEVEWQNIQLGETCPTFFVTIETRELFAQAYPKLVEEFNDNEATKLSKKPKKQKPAKIPSMSDGYENEVEFLSKQLEDLSVHHSSEHCHGSVTQSEKHYPGVISDTSNDDSLQDIIDSILPSASNDHSLHSQENSRPFAKVDDADRKFSAAVFGSNSSDDDDVYNDDDDDDDDDVFVGGDDDDDVLVGADGDDNDDIPWDFKPLLTEVERDNLDPEKGLKTHHDSEKLKPLKLKGIKTTSDLQDVLECINMDDYDYDSDGSNNSKPIQCPQFIPSSGGQIVSMPSHDNKGRVKNSTCTKRQSVKTSMVKPIQCPPTLADRKELDDLQPVPSSGSQVKSSDENERHAKNPTCTKRQSAKTSGVKPIQCPPALVHRKELEELQSIPSSGSQIKPSDNNKRHVHNPTCAKRQSVKTSRFNTALNDADLIEIFGSSDEEEDNKSLFKSKQSPCTTKLKGGTKATRLGGLKSRNQVPDDVFHSLDATKCPQRPLQELKTSFSSTTDHNSALMESCSNFINSSIDCLSSILKEDSRAKSNASSSKTNVDVNCTKGTKANGEEIARATRKVLEPTTMILNNASQSSVHWFDSHNTDGVDGICSRGSSGKLQGCESWKENADSSFDDYMPAPLLQRLGKKFSAKQRLASLHSISSVKDDI